jgi:Na+/melibiose symporter-like transporter
VEQRHPGRRRQLLRALLHSQDRPGHRRGVAAHTIGLGGYIATAKTQTGSALTSIRVAAGIIPAALFLAAAAVMLVYPLTEKAFRAIVAEMAERRAAAELASAGRRMT